MKKIILVVFCFSGFATSAQNGFYLQARLGAGISYVAAHDNLRLGTYENEGEHNVLVPVEELGIGYRVNHLEISSGIFLFKSGYYEHTLSGSYFLTDTKTTQHYNHIALPMIASYRFRIGKRFSIAPGFGYAVSYNYADYKTINQNGTVTNETLTGGSFTSQYHEISLWTTVKVELGYKLKNGITLMISPQFEDMLTSMLPPGYNVAAYQYSRVFSLNVGDMRNFRKKKTAE